MESHKAGEKIHQEERTSTKLKIRKEKLRNLLTEKRNLQAYQKEEKYQKIQPPLEEMEVEIEVKKTNKTPNLTNYYTKTKRQSKKKCWCCGSKYHTKKYCPYIQCFYCKRYGHMKAQCHMRKIDVLLENITKEKENKKHKKKKKQEKKKIQMEQVNIYKYRLKDSKFVKKDQCHLLQYNEKPIGMYMMPTIPPDLEQMKKKHINWKKVDLFLHSDVQIEKVTLLDNFLNWCSCGKTNLTKKEFISHVNLTHKGYIKKNSQVNLPVWIYGVVFTSDSNEELFCRSTEPMA